MSQKELEVVSYWKELPVKKEKNVKYIMINNVLKEVELELRCNPNTIIILKDHGLD